MIAEIDTEPTAMCRIAATTQTISSGKAVLAEKCRPRMSPRPMFSIVSASEPPTPLRMRICQLSRNPLRSASSIAAFPAAG